MDEEVLGTLKILIIGESGVGKSSLLLRFTDDMFDPMLSATIGVDFKVKTINVNDNKMKLAIWVNLLILNNILNYIFHDFKLFIKGYCRTSN